MQIAQTIIQILLYEGGPMKLVDLAKFLNIKKEEVEQNILEMENLLATLDLKLIRNATTLEIALGNEASKLINKNKIEELKSELSESALQTLAVIIYKDRATAAEINFVRGVDSGRSLKNLLTRGLIERLEEKNRKYYIPSTETLRYLNIETVEKVINYNEISGKLKQLIEGDQV